MKVLCPLGIFLCTLAVLPCVSAQSAQPNILLIYVDDLGYGDLGSYGHTVLKTPNIDALAADGLKLTSYYAPSALCSPSRAGLLTGRYPYRTGINSWIPDDSGVFLRSEEITLAETLKSAGYQTAHIGKWHLKSGLGRKNEPQPTDQGFDYFYGHNTFQKQTNRNPTNIFRNGDALPTQEGYTAELYAGVTEPGTTSDVPVVGTDLFVTLTAIGGAAVPTDRPIDGLDVRPVLSGGDLPQRSIV